MKAGMGRVIIAIQTRQYQPAPALDNNRPNPEIEFVKNHCGRRHGSSGSPGIRAMPAQNGSKKPENTLQYPATSGRQWHHGLSQR